MGRTTFLPALGHHRGRGQTRTCSSSPLRLPDGVPDGVSVATSDSAAELLERMRSTVVSGDVHLVGGPRTIQAFRAIGALDELELLVVPFVLGDGLPLSPAGTPQLPLELARERSYPDGVVRLTYTFR